MADKWYFARDGKQAGPFSAAQLQELAVGGQLRPQDTVWKEGMAKGVPAVKVRKLFSDRQLPAPAPAPAEQAPPAPVSSTPILTTASAPPASLPASTTALAARLASPEELELVPIADSPAAGQPAAADLHAESRSVPESKKARPPEAAARQLRVLGVKGGVLSSQDGTRVKFRKTCLRCGYADTSMTTMPIRSGVTRANFFCPKCKKSQQVEVQGVG